MELGPRIFQAGCDESRFVVGRRERRFSKMFMEQRVMLRLELQSADRRSRQGSCDVHDKRICDLLLGKGIC